MISKKIFAADGSNIRFLSDFIIRSEQFTRVYNYVFDENGVEGDIDPISGLFIRVSDVPNSADLVTIDRWDLVDNSISFYIPPYASSRVYIEVATTSEEFGDTLVQPSVERAEEAARAAEAAQAAAEAAQAASEAAQALAATSQIAAAASQAAAALSEANAGDSEVEAAASAAAALASQAAALASEGEATAQAAASAAQAAASTASAASSLASSTASEASADESQVFAWEAEAERLTADSYATQLEDVFVNIYTSNGNGTFTATPTTSYSALHWSTKAEGHALASVLLDGSRDMTGNLEAPSVSIGGDYVSPHSLRNYIINGNFEIWQRGTSFPDPLNIYTADRWKMSVESSSGTSSVQYSENNLNDELRYTRTVTGVPPSGVDSWYGVTQHIENPKRFSGKTLTFSVYMYADVASGATFSPRVNIHFGTGGSSRISILAATPITLTSTRTRYSVTFVVPDLTIYTFGANPSMEMFLPFPLNDVLVPWLRIGKAQLEEGSVATPFEERPKAFENDLCARYYQKAFNVSIASAFASTQAYSSAIYFSTKMREAFPTISLTNMELFTTTWTAVTGAAGNPSDTNFYAHIAATGLVDQNSYLFRSNWEADAEF